MFSGASCSASPWWKTIRSSTSARDAVDLAHDQRRGVAGLRSSPARAHEDLGGAADPAERVLHLVRDAGGDLAEGVEALALADPLRERAVRWCGRAARAPRPTACAAALAERRGRHVDTSHGSRSGARTRTSSSTWERARRRARARAMRTKSWPGRHALERRALRPAPAEISSIRHASAFTHSTRRSASTTSTPSSSASSTPRRSCAMALRPPPPGAPKKRRVPAGAGGRDRRPPAPPGGTAALPGRPFE